MNKPHKWAKEIKAWADGAAIESRDNIGGGWSAWRSAPHPAWVIGDQTEYRIKAEPREWWTNVYDTSVGFLYLTKQEAHACALKDRPGYRTILVREVE